MSDIRNNFRNNFRRGGMQGGRPDDKPKDFSGTMRKVFKYIGHYRRQLLLVLIFAVGGSVFNIIGPRILGRATTEIFHGLMRQLSGGEGVDFNRVASLLLTALGLYVTSSLSSLVMGYVMTGISQRTSYRMRREIAAKIHRMPMKYFEEQTHGDVLSRVTNDVDTLGQSLNQSAPQMITSTTTIVGAIVMMMSINVLMALLTLIILPLSLVILSVIIKKSQTYFRDQQKQLGEVNGQVEEVFSGHVVVKAFNKEASEVKKFKQINDKLYESALKSQFISGIMMPLMGFVGNLGYVGVVILGGVLTIRRVIEVGDIQAFIQYVRNLTWPLQQIAQATSMLQSTMAAAERVFAFLEEEEEVAEVEKPISEDMIKGNVSFVYVRFGYQKDKEVIHNFSATIREGQKVAIVGPTGAGKTTMIKLLMRFYDVDGGTILLDGYNIKNFRRGGLRQMFGMVLQDTWLFRGSIRDNISYGKLDATDEEVVAAAKAARVHHFVKTLPGGYEMELNEDATNVSQGQKQLLTIARAFLANPKVLILDEATSSVDTRTEIQIQKAMDTLMKGRTSFVIAHRLSTIRNADVILVMNEGDIVEQGNHQELLDKGGFYAELYYSQFENASV